MIRYNKVFLLIFSILLALLITAVVSASDCGTGYGVCNCGDNLMTNYTLTEIDPITSNTCSGIGIILSEDGITLDCNGFTITGLGNGSGIITWWRIDNIGIKNCNIDNFYKGIVINNNDRDQQTTTLIINNSITNFERFAIYTFNWTRHTKIMYNSIDCGGSSNPWNRGMYVSGNNQTIFCNTIDNCVDYSLSWINCDNTGDEIHLPLKKEDAKSLTVGNVLILFIFVLVIIFILLKLFNKEKNIY